MSKLFSHCSNKLSFNAVKKTQNNNLVLVYNNIKLMANKQEMFELKWKQQNTNTSEDN